MIPDETKARVSFYRVVQPKNRRFNVSDIVYPADRLVVGRSGRPCIVS